MKKTYYLLLILALTLFNACDDKHWNGDELIKTEGTLLLSSLEISINNAIYDVNSMSDSILTSDSVDTSNFIVSIINQQSNEVLYSWVYSQIPNDINLNEGDYIIEVKSHEVAPAQWEKPYFYGTQSISIKEKEISAASLITCALNGVKVFVNFSPDLYQVLNNDANVKVYVTEDSFLEYRLDESRAGYFTLPSSTSSIIAEFNGIINNEKITAYKVIQNVEIGQLHNIVFSFEDLKNTENPNAPTITSETLDIDSTNVITENIIAKVDINAPYGIKNVVVDIISEQLTKEMLQDVGLDATFDLANPGNLEEALSELGFPTGSKVYGQTYLAFDITDFMQLLVIFPGLHEFKLTVTDMQGNTITKSLKFLAQESAPEETNGPTITSNTLDIDSANVITENIVAKVDINAPNGIKNFVVDIISDQLSQEVLQDVGLDATFDLANPGNLGEALSELGFPTGDAVLGKTNLTFDITDFMQLLVVFPGQHQFKLTITDNKDITVSKTLTFIAQ